LNYQARLVDRKIFVRGKWRPHAWIEVYDSKLRKWAAYDITGNDFKLRTKRKKLDTYQDWSEWEKVYKRKK